MHDETDALLTKSKLLLAESSNWDRKLSEFEKQEKEELEKIVKDAKYIIRRIDEGFLAESK